MMVHGGYVYILCNKRKTVLHTGVTSNLLVRLHEHRSGAFPGSFTSRYNTFLLVYYEGFHHIEEAIAREKQIKGGSRKKKELLIESMNPGWNDLSNDVED